MQSDLHLHCLQMLLMSSSVRKELVVVYFRLFIVATGRPSERRAPRRLVVTGNRARIQDDTTESSVWFFNESVYSAYGTSV